MGYVYAAAYLIVAVVLWVPLYKWQYRTHQKEFPTLEWDSGERMFAICWGAYVCLLWCTFLPAYFLYQLFKLVRPLARKLEK